MTLNSTQNLDVAAVMFDMTGYSLPRPAFTYPLMDNETWTNVDLKADQDGVLRMKMNGENDGSA